MAAAMEGSLWPCRVTHQLLMASISPAAVVEVQHRSLGAAHMQWLGMEGHLGGGVPEVRVPGHPGRVRRCVQVCRALAASACFSLA